MEDLINGYKLQKYLGKGDFGLVYKAINVLTGAEVALKTIDKSKIDKDKYLKEEAEHLPKIKNKNIILFYEYFEKQNFFYFILEYANNGNLMNYIKEKGGRLEETEALFFLKQIMNGYKALAENQIMHRDLKLENILLNKEKDGTLTIKICDFDFIKKAIIGKTYCGTTPYMAPEIINKQLYTNQTDLWAVGVIYYRIIYGKFPFGPFGDETYDEYQHHELKTNIRRVNVNYYENDERFNISRASIQFLKQIFILDVNERIDWEKAFIHPLFKEKQISPKIEEDKFIIVEKKENETLEEEKKQITEERKKPILEEQNKNIEIKSFQITSANNYNNYDNLLKKNNSRKNSKDEPLPKSNYYSYCYCFQRKKEKN